MGIRKSEEEIDKMCVIFENTGNLREVVRELGSNTVTVSKYLKERGYTVELGTKKYSPKIKDKAMKMYKDGYTAKEISNKLDISIDSVLAEKRKREIPIYPRSEYKIKENASKEEVGLGVIAFFDSDNYNTMDEYKKFAKKNNFYSLYEVVKHFGSWTQAIKKLNLTYKIKDIDISKISDKTNTNLKKEYSKRDLIIGLRRLTEELKRIPVKTDLLICDYLPEQKIFQKRFKSYYTALDIAGISGILNNGISNVYFSKDGHLCNSAEEAIIDDLLFENNIEHEKEVNYPDSRYIADWKIGDLYIEYTSIENFKRYADRLKRKVAFIEENNLNVLFLGKKDLINQKFIKKFK